MIINKNNILYIHCFTEETIYAAVKLEKSIGYYLSNYFDIVSIFEIDKIDPSKYKLVLINAICFVEILTGLSETQLFVFLDKIKNTNTIKHIVFMMHDLHEYSLSITYEPEHPDGISYYCQGPVLYETKSKNNLKLFLQIYNVKNLISIYDCPEHDYLARYCTNIDKFHMINHGYDPNIFKSILCKKKYDVIFYGSSSPTTYPLRRRLTILMNNIGIRFRSINHDEDIEKSELAEIINQSWICIADVSNFSYFVRKYLEISACNCIVLGDINNQGYNIIGSNLIYVNNVMFDDHIIQKVKYYLSNKEIMAALSYNKLENVIKENYENYAIKLNEIAKSIINNTESLYTFHQNYNNLHLDNLTHVKNLINIKFTKSKEYLISDKQLDRGLYTLKCYIKGSLANYDIYDSNKKLITNVTTYLSDANEPYIYYIPFKLTNVSNILISNNFSDKKLEFYIINEKF